MQSGMSDGDDFLPKEGEKRVVNDDESSFSLPISSLSSCSLSFQENKCCCSTGSDKRTGISEPKPSLKMVESRDLNIDSRKIYVELDVDGVQKIHLPKKEEILTQTINVMEHVKVGYGENMEMTVPREAQAVNIHPSRQAQLQEVDSGAAIHETDFFPFCDNTSGCRDRSSMERTGSTAKMVKSCSTSIPATMAGYEPKAIANTEEMVGQQCTLAGSYCERDIVLEDGERDYMQVLVQMLVTERMLTTECKRELNSEQIAHQATKDELNRILLSTAASNKAAATLKEEGGRGSYDDDDDDDAVVVDQGETLNSLTMELKRLATELKVRSGPLSNHPCLPHQSNCLCYHKRVHSPVTLLDRF